MSVEFPKDFLWGVAAASYQVEGAAYEDGKGLSDWDVFCRKPGAIWSGHTGDVSCDQYHRYREDVALMKELGVKAYRLSTSWPRVLPNGTGAVNEKGLDYYDRLVDELLAAGIQPLVTLFHWDYPHELLCRGGWLNRESPDWFAEYSAVVAARLSDRVGVWMPLNEPQVFTDLGHRTGTHAPGYCLERSDLLRAAHNVLLAHGKSVKAIRESSKRKCMVGFASATSVCMPPDGDERNIEAARLAMFTMRGEHLFQNSWWMDPMFKGLYPESGLRLFGQYLPRNVERDMETISQPLDFLGCNIYNGRYVRATSEGSFEEVPLPAGYNRTSQTDWPVTPDSLYWGPRFFHERYKVPIMITENGHQNLDGVSLDGKVHDPQRIDYLKRYLRELKRAIDDGVNVIGYCQWTFLDNFEWALGYNVRVGMVHVDYATQRRTPKDSAFWYKEVIESNGASLST